MTSREKNLLGGLAVSWLLSGLIASFPTAAFNLFYGVGDIQANAYQNTGAAFMATAEVYVAGVYAFGDAQAYVYTAVSDTLHSSAATMAASVAQAIGQADSSVTGTAQWYKDSNKKVEDRLEPSNY